MVNRNKVREFLDWLEAERGMRLTDKQGAPVDMRRIGELVTAFNAGTVDRVEPAK